MIRRLLVLLLLGLLGLAGWLYWYAHSPALDPAREEAGRDVSFSIPSGASLRTVAQRLEAAGLLDEPWAFTLMARLQGHETRVRAGSYLLRPAMAPMDILERITEGGVRLARITFIEGWTFRQMREAIDHHPDLGHDTAQLSDADLMARLGVAEPSPEGLFFPDTYYFDVASSELSLYRRAHETLRQRLSAAWQSRAEGLPYRSPYEALVMASIIEKETGAPDERPLIAAVFVNRLRIGMRLQTDPTVIYGLGANFDGNLRKSDLLTDTPYNTYTRAGLPPTPIALPSEAALQAAVRPERSRALYFVAKGRGRHHFSETLNEHNRAVSRYQRGR
ncbi:MAG TPA: endolytic transglycosylase MltG [Thiobacillaceae bacterium]|nr:endolytic transglycosylase MltG [Thiobacillaceae bacterium]